ncbi:type II secretion system protein GspC [Bdellovibrio sp. HCB337]|uniref:type II secretion system protein GspC n=1 Tax=Bdellovibrio sp. HCB337 TaxID=3394358 RepID=UPI0039A64957
MAIDNKKQAKKKRPAFEKWLSYLLFVFIGFVIADLLILSYRDLMLPNQTPPARPKKLLNDNLVSRGAYNTIISRNIFSADGVIPDPLIAKGQDPNNIKEADPVPSQLPLNLIGTLVHSNADKSIAAIEIRGKNQILSYTPKRNIENLATLLKVERQRIVFRNLNTNVLEFIEMKPFGNNKVAFGASAPAAPASQGSGEVKNMGDNKFTIKRADLQKYLNDLSSILMQARAVPARDKVTGEVIGYRIVDFQPNSIFSQLGIQRMDLIKNVNGEPVDTPQKAMELFNMFKNSNNIKMSVDRGGRVETLDYTIQ